MTPNRGIDADFLDLPRHELADAALSAAKPAGASHADLITPGPHQNVIYR